MPHQILCDYGDVPVMSYGGYCGTRRITIDGGLPNPSFGVSPVVGAARQPARASLLEGVSVRKSTAFSSHEECVKCHYYRVRAEKAATVEERRGWQRREGQSHHYLLGSTWHFTV
jgi:hypothetical protein